MCPAGPDDGPADGPSRRRLLAATGGLGAALLAGCTGDPDGDGGDGGTGGSTDGTSGSSGGGSDGDGESAATWRTAELTTVRGDESFSIAELSAPVVIQSFAVWCPKCQRQSEALAELGDSVTVVGLNTDPNEDAEKVRTHAEGNGFDWRFAVSPPAMTESLIDAFGTTVTNAPSTPVIVSCGDGSAEFMAGSIQLASELRTAAGDC